MSSSTQSRGRILALAPAPGSPSAPAPAGPGALTLLRLQLFGQYNLADGTSHACRTLQIDQNQISLSCQVAGRPGDQIDVNLDLLGQLRGVIEGRMAAGLRIDMGQAYQEHIVEKLTWFMDQGASDSALPFKARAAERIVPWSTACQFVDPDGKRHQARILNISRSGAALATVCQPPVGAPIGLGLANRRNGLVVRHFESGFAIAFLTPIPETEFGHGMMF